MDNMSAILVNVLSAIMSAAILAVVPLVIQRIRQRKAPSLSPELQATKAYQDILRGRKSDRGVGYVLLASLAFYVALAVIIGLPWWHIQVLILPILLPIVALLSLYAGYSPISTYEVEQRRQRVRADTLREALGRTPYGYISQNIIFPVIALLYIVMLLVIGILVTTIFRWMIPIIAVITIPAICAMYIQVRDIRRAIAYLRRIPHDRQQELQRELSRQEFEN